MLNKSQIILLLHPHNAVPLENNPLLRPHEGWLYLVVVD